VRNPLARKAAITMIADPERASKIIDGCDHATLELLCDAVQSVEREGEYADADCRAVYTQIVRAMQAIDDEVHRACADLNEALRAKGGPRQYAVTVSITSATYALPIIRERIEQITKRIERNGKTPNREQLERELQALRDIAFTLEFDVLTPHGELIKAQLRDAAKELAK
jgi:hypothetical protein